MSSKFRIETMDSPTVQITITRVSLCISICYNKIILYRYTVYTCTCVYDLGSNPAKSNKRKYNFERSHDGDESSDEENKEMDGIDDDNIVAYIHNIHVLYLFL